METITLRLSCTDLTHADLEDLRELHKFISEMADEKIRNHLLAIIEGVCAAIERKERVRGFAEHLRLDAANAPTLAR